MDLPSGPNIITKVLVRGGSRIRVRKRDVTETEVIYSRQPLGARKGKKMDSSLEPPEVRQCYGPIQDSGSPELEINLEQIINLHVLVICYQQHQETNTAGKSGIIAGNITQTGLKSKKVHRFTY